MNNYESNDEIDSLYERFRKALETNEVRRIESFLDELAVSLRPAALYWLLKEEVEHIRKQRRLPDSTEYLERFPDQASVIRDVFQPIRAKNEVVGDRFRLIDLLGAGGMGEVFLAIDTEMEREVALKCIQHDLDDEAWIRFDEEVRLTGQLEHRGIVPIYHSGKDDKGPYYVMRVVRGANFNEAIDGFHKSYRRSFASLTFRQLLARFVDVCNAVSFAHTRGVLHRDLKPSNIMLGKYGETFVVDWGESKLLEHETADNVFEAASMRIASGAHVESTATGSVKGSPSYMSPEQAHGRIDEICPATDVFGLGATLAW